MNDDRIIQLLSLVIDNYIERWDPVGSKFLFSLEETQYAPSTLRKYLNILEKEGFLYQPYNSAGRIPTIKWLTRYVDTIIQNEDFALSEMDVTIDDARKSLRGVVESLWEFVDWVAVGFLKDDEYYFLWINNLLRDSMMADYDAIKYLVKFIEDKKIIEFLDKKLIRKKKINYDFIQNDEKIISTIYSKVDVNGYDSIIAIMWPTRMNYKRNFGILKKFLQDYGF